MDQIGYNIGRKLANKLHNINHNTKEFGYKAGRKLSSKLNDINYNTGELGYNTGKLAANIGRKLANKLHRVFSDTQNANFVVYYVLNGSVNKHNISTVSAVDAVNKVKSSFPLGQYFRAFQIPEELSSALDYESQLSDRINN